jgi:hypothetical protein
LQSRFASSSVVGGSERVISYCAEEHGGRGVYLNKGGIEYRSIRLLVWLGLYHSIVGPVCNHLLRTRPF